jgi:hypothetical protein
VGQYHRYLQVTRKVSTLAWNPAGVALGQKKTRARRKELCVAANRPLNSTGSHAHVLGKNMSNKEGVKQSITNSFKSEKNRLTLSENVL